MGCDKAFRHHPECRVKLLEDFLEISFALLKKMASLCEEHGRKECLREDWFGGSCRSSDANISWDWVTVRN